MSGLLGKVIDRDKLAHTIHSATKNDEGPPKEKSVKSEFLQEKIKLGGLVLGSNSAFLVAGVITCTYQEKPKATYVELQTTLAERLKERKWMVMWRPFIFLSLEILEPTPETQ